MGNPPFSSQEKHPVEPDHNTIYLDYGPPLPDSYNQDIIVVLIRDPECVFSYWELSGTVVATTLQNITKSNLKWILRVHSLSQKSFNDITIATPQNYANIQGNYYLTVFPDTQYQLELGVFTDGNEFISLVKSNIVKTPRLNKAPMTDITSYIK
jgi:hypothetical protein